MPSACRWPRAACRASFCAHNLRVMCAAFSLGHPLFILLFASVREPSSVSDSVGFAKYLEPSCAAPHLCVCVWHSGGTRERRKRLNCLLYLTHSRYAVMVICSGGVLSSFRVGRPWPPKRLVHPRIFGEDGLRLRFPDIASLTRCATLIEVSRHSELRLRRRISDHLPRLGGCRSLGRRKQAAEVVKARCPVQSRRRTPDFAASPNAGIIMCRVSIDVGSLGGHVNSLPHVEQQWCLSVLEVSNYGSLLSYMFRAQRSMRCRAVPCEVREVSCS